MFDFHLISFHLISLHLPDFAMELCLFARPRCGEDASCIE